MIKKGKYVTIYVIYFPIGKKVIRMKNRVKELRHQHGISQIVLADAIGVTKRTIYAIETENNDIHISDKKRKMDKNLDERSTL